MSQTKLENLEQQVGQNIKKIRVTKGFSQADTARALGISPQQFQKYEKGTNRISAGKLHLLSKFFDIPISNFFDSADFENIQEDLCYSKNDLKLLRIFKLLQKEKTKKEAIEFFYYLNEIEKEVKTGS